MSHKNSLSRSNFQPPTPLKSIDLQCGRSKNERQLKQPDLALSHQPARASWNENNFAEGAGLQNFFVRSGSLGERQLLPDDGPQRAILQTGEE